jgi:hypothetical protein
MQHLRHHPRTAAAFFLIPILFNLVMWQNYPMSAQCVLPNFILGLGITNALLVFGLCFGLFTGLFAGVCIFSFLGFGPVLKNLKLNAHIRRHCALYAISWVVAFTGGSFAGFLLIICLSDDEAHANLYYSGFQGFLIAGLAAGAATLVLSFVVALLKDKFANRTEKLELS